MSNVNIINAFGKAILVFGIILIVGALFAYYYNIYGVHPYREHAFILGVFGVASFFAGLTLLHSESKFMQI